MKPIYIDIHIHTSKNPGNLNYSYDVDVLKNKIEEVADGSAYLISLTQGAGSGLVMTHFRLIFESESGFRIKYGMTMLEIATTAAQSRKAYYLKMCANKGPFVLINDSIIVMFIKRV